MYSNDQMAFELPDFHDQNSMTLCWCLLSEWGRECVAFSFAYSARQYLIHERPQPITTQITHDAEQKLLTLRLRSFCHMGIHNMLSFNLA